VKRLFDLAFILVLTPIWLPVLGILAILVRVFIGAPVLFKQVRAGRNAKPFTLIKFRTMKEAGETTSELVSDAQRLTTFGRFLRSISLDELPELFNVLHGEMSLVGPRPLLTQYVGRYTAQQARRHEIRPGMTGWAQVNGRNAISWEEKFRLDIWYVDHRSLWLDVKIILLTAREVILRHGIAALGEATMPEFRGTDSPPE
jgi:sugar transferase EpsL